MKRNKVKGSLTVEAIVAVPLFALIFITVIFSMRLYVIQGVIHTVSISAMEQVNRASQLIYAAALENKQLGEPTDENISDFTLLACGKINPYGQDAKDIFSSMPGLNKDSEISIYKNIIISSLNESLYDYIEDQLPGEYNDSFDIQIDEVTLTEDTIGKKITCDYTYTLSYPLSFLNNGSITKTVHLCTYLD